MTKERVSRTPEERQMHRRLQDAADSFQLAARAARSGNDDEAEQHATQGMVYVREARKLGGE